MSRLTSYVHLARHGVFIGSADVDAEGAVVLHLDRADKREVLAPLLALNGCAFPSEAALYAALDAAWGPERVAALDAAEAEREAERQAAWAEAEAAARARTFTGAAFDPDRPLAAIPPLIARDLRAAVKAGTLPPDRYRVTFRRERGWQDNRLLIWAWRRFPILSPMRAAVEAIANRYNRCEGKPYLLGYDDRCPDVWHFEVEIERPRVTKAGPGRALWLAYRGPLDAGRYRHPGVGLSYDAFCTQVHALEVAAAAKDGVDLEAVEAEREAAWERVTR